MTTLPLIMTIAGPQPTPPAALDAALIALVTSTNPGYTANLPLSLIEDISSTCVGALTLIDQFRVETVNSVTPYGANSFIANQLGQIYGVPQGVGTNTYVYVVFSGPAGYVVPKGFTVSDGTYQYIVQDGGAVSGGGSTVPLYCLATSAGSWAVPANTVTTISTSVPAGVTLTCTNPTPGTPSTGPQDPTDYQAQVLQAGLAASQGFASRLRTELARVPGVQPRLVAPVQTATNNWEIIVGGGDPYLVAYAIYSSLFDFWNIVGSQLQVTNISVANPGVVTTNFNHGFSNGQTVTITGVVGMTAVNGVLQTVTVIDEKHFSIENTSSFSAYVSGGTLSPNNRNVSASISDYPSVYTINFVNPPQQSVSISLTWNTISNNYVSPAAVQQLGSQALVAYVNSIPVGQPINLFELQNAFQLAVADILPIALLTRMVFAVSINGVSTPPEINTGIIAGDPESYFLTNSTMVAVVQG